jgi:hypothetical protein
VPGGINAFPDACPAAIASALSELNFPNDAFAALKMWSQPPSLWGR